MTTMPPKLSVHEFMDLLRKSGLVKPEAFEKYRDVPASRVAYQMVSDGLLTEFQAKQLIGGKFRKFFIADKYKILDVLGRGGMGRVFLCEHLLLQRLVAVKLMFRSRETKPGAGERFLREARAAARFDHVNLARVFDVDITSTGPYIVMEYIDGINLHELSNQPNSLAWERATNYIRQAALGLQQAHQAGLVHRDIKPSNLMLDRTGVVKLLDLGLARFFDQDADDGLTSAYNPNAVLGTADFIAPEQALDCSRADIRADIYSLGCSLYYMLVRKLPAGTGTTIQKLLRHQSKEPESIRQLRPDVPEELVAIVERMMRKEPEARYQTPQEIVEALAPLTGQALLPPATEELPASRWANYVMGMSASASSRALLEAKTPTLGMNGPKQSTVGSAGPLSELVPLSSGGDFVAHAPSMSLTATHDPLDPLAGAASLLSGPAKSPLAIPAALPKHGEAAPLPATTSVQHEFKITFTQLAHYQKIVIGVLGTMFLLMLSLYLLTWLNSGHGEFVPPPVIANRPNRPSPQEVPSETPPETPSQQSLTVPLIAVRGGGSSFVKPMMDHWETLYREQKKRKIEYTSAGSSKGVEGVLSNFLDFGCSDAPLTDQQIADAGVKVQHIPLVMGAVVPTFNLTDEKGEHLPVRFTGALLANIFLGNIKKWNDPALVANNPGVKLPDQEITVVVRKDGSGTTNIWTDYLSKQSAAWKTRVGVGNSVNWPVGLKGDKNNGVADLVSRTTGSIGYVELSYAIANSLPVGPVRNKAGNYILASPDSISAAAAGSTATIPDDFRYSITDAEGAGSYPIVGTTWALVRLDLPDAKKNELREFFLWATHEGQKPVAELHYGPLPPELIVKIDAALASWK